MSITATYRATLIAVNIIAGAINTTGKIDNTKLINSKISKWSSKDNTTNIFSIPTCK